MNHHHHNQQQNVPNPLNQIHQQTNPNQHYPQQQTNAHYPRQPEHDLISFPQQQHQMTGLQMVETPIVNDVEDIKTVTYFQGKPIRQQWFMVIYHGHMPMLNAPVQRAKRLDELKSIAKSVLQTNSQERRKLLMKITNNDHDDCGSLELKFYLPKVNTFQFKVDCRKIDLFKRSRKDRTFFYFTVMPDHTGTTKDASGSKHMPAGIVSNQYECQIYHAVGMSNAEFIANLMEKQIEINLKELKLSTKQMMKMNKNNKSSAIGKPLELNLAEVEKARTADGSGNAVIKQSHSSGSIGGMAEHPLDESLEEVSNNVPTLLDLDVHLKYNSNTVSTNPFLTIMNDPFVEPAITTTTKESNTSIPTAIITPSNMMDNQQAQSSSSFSWQSNRIGHKQSETAKVTIQPQQSQASSNQPNLTSTTNLAQASIINNQNHENQTANFDEDFQTFISQRFGKF